MCPFCKEVPQPKFHPWMNPLAHGICLSFGSLRFWSKRSNEHPRSRNQRWYCSCVDSHKIVQFMLLTMESVPSAVLNRRVSTDGGSLSRKDSFIDLWDAVAESSNRRDRCNNDHVQNKKPQQVNSQSSKGRNAYPSNEFPGESRRGSLSPRRHSRSPSRVDHSSRPT